MRGGLRGLRRQAEEPGDERRPLSVSALTRSIKTLLEGGLGRVAVEGEIANLKRAASGHLYFSLKDEYAALDVVMWRSAAAKLRFEPRDGERAEARGEITVYEPRGRYQLAASSLAPVGKGDLRRRFEELVEKLRAEGLFAPEHKKPLPEAPGTVGVVTSPAGAAVRDIIKILRRRMPGVRIVLSPCAVQGAAAAEEIAAALGRLDAWGGCDAIIVGRGGGSQEDLQAFNEEVVARAVFAAKTPVVSAVGHEVDITICDLVADYRAATPSEAAEAVVPDRAEYGRRVAALRRALARALLGRAREAELRVRALARSQAFARPLDLVRLRQQRLDEACARLRRASGEVAERRGGAVTAAAARLEALSPLGVLARGYSVTLDAATGRALKDAAGVRTGDEIRTRLGRGELRSTVTAARAAEE